MKKIKLAALILGAAAVTGLSSTASAGTIMECKSSVTVPAVPAVADDPKTKNKNEAAPAIPAYEMVRSWTLGLADACDTVDKSVHHSSDIEALGGLFQLGEGLDWTDQGSFASDNDIHAWLDVGVTEGSWGSSPVKGTWAFANNFWSTFDKAVLAIHNGNGKKVEGMDDSALFFITKGTVGGTWGFSQLFANGGGLSEFKLWTTPNLNPDPTPDPFPPVTPTPEPGAMLLFGAALFGLGLRRRQA